MRIVKLATIREYAGQFPDAHDQLLLWLKVARAAQWNSLAEVRRAYPHADGVAVGSGHTATVFNIRGNRYRLIVAIKYQWAMIYVLRFLTHAQYTKDLWKEQL